MGKKVVVTGAGGFIGGHFAARLRRQGHTVTGIDAKPVREWENHTTCADMLEMDLKQVGARALAEVLHGADEVYALAADMGGMGFIERHKLDCMLSVNISTNTFWAAQLAHVPTVFYASSACVYPAYRQNAVDLPALKEEDAYPADAEDGYGWEKLFSERMARHFHEETSVKIAVARFHNVYGPEGTWAGGREKAPAAICRKVAEAKLSGRHVIEIWGDGSQQRSYMYIDDCLEGIERITAAMLNDPINLGSSELVSVNELVDLVETIAFGRTGALQREYDLSAPQGVKGRNSDNTRIQRVLGWEPSTPLAVGLEQTYSWVEKQVAAHGA